jgi:hypothetical protein
MHILFSTDYFLIFQAGSWEHNTKPLVAEQPKCPLDTIYCCSLLRTQSEFHDLGTQIDRNIISELVIVIGEI